MNHRRHPWLPLAVGCVLLAGLFALPAAAQNDGFGGQNRVDPPVEPYVFDGDLRDLPTVPGWRPGDPIKEIPRREVRPPQVLFPAPPPLDEDPLLRLQEKERMSGLQRAFTTPGLNFAGQGYSGVNPPDTVGDIGPDYFIQMINGSGGAIYTVYDKTNGSLVAGPTSLDSLGSGQCGNGLGDPVVLWDDLADRWVLAEFSSAGNNMCVYVSQTSDPITGGWYAYAFSSPNFPDYFKIGVWDDAYYAGSNESSPTIYAFERSAMLNGQPASSQRSTLPSLGGFGFQLATPSSVTGATPPPSGSPNYFMRHRDDEAHNPGSANPSEDYLEIFEYKSNFGGSPTLNGPISIAVAEFDSTLCGLTSFSCIQQPGTSTRLDPLREPIMFRLQYRNFGSHESLVGNFAVDVGSDRAGVRWFELRRTGGAWSLYQEGTFAPGSDSRWMGAIAQDQDGNIALGYNYGSSSVHPELRYVGRLSSDTLGTLPQGEVQIVDGTASNGSNRYGDYASMGVDPVDGCTFWFTGEYNTSSSWSTRIASFKFDSCGGGPVNTAPSVTITAPGDGSSFDVGTSVGFSGTATDVEDGTLTSSLSWSSSIDGAIGSGGSFSTSALSIGVHTITASVTDSGGLPGSDSIQVTVSDPNSNGPQTAVYDAGLGAPACAIAGSSCDSTTLLEGRDSVGPEQNQPNTLDSCTDGSSGTYLSDESNERIVVSTLDSSDFTAGATVQVDVTVYAWSTGSSDTLDLYYAANANSPSWQYITSIVPPAGGLQTLSAQYTLPPGSLQAVRANFRYQGSTSPCSGGNYDDADDLVFAVGGGPVNTAPSVTITSPADGSSFDEGTSVSFAGTATDAEDGSLTGSLSWSSSLDGTIGSGGSFSTSSLSVGSHTITASVTDSGGLPGSDSISVTIDPVVGGGICDGTNCIDWDVTPTESYATQDADANVQVQDGGDTLYLQDNTWRRTVGTYTVTANTVVEFDFTSTVEGEIHGIGLDEDNTLSSNRIFKVHGTQSYGITDFDNYSGGTVSYSIPVGQYFTGSAMNLVLVNDNDAGSGNDSAFTNVRVYEDTPPGGTCAADVTFESGAEGWANDASSTCATGDFVVGTPTQVTNGGVVTQLAGAHGGSNAYFSATNSSAGVDDVDGGTCVVLSPVYSVSEASDVSAWYYHGQRDAGGDSGDFFALEISTDGGSTWSTLASYGDETVNASWTQATTTVPAGSSVRFRLRVADGPTTGDLVEAGIDDVSICPQ